MNPYKSVLRIVKKYPLGYLCFLFVALATSTTTCLYLYNVIEKQQKEIMKAAQTRKAWDNLSYTITVIEDFVAFVIILEVCYFRSIRRVGMVDRFFDKMDVTWDRLINRDIKIFLRRWGLLW